MDGIKRFTTEYVVPDDRLRLSLETYEGQVSQLWLTRRLCVRMIPQIVKILDSRTVASMKDAASSEQSQRHSQMGALVKMEPQTPVQAADSVEDHLVAILTIRLQRHAFLLDFKTGEDNLIVTLPFPEAAMRQWLVILNGAFRRAEWGDPIWPEWISLKGGENGATPVLLN